MDIFSFAALADYWSVPEVAANGVIVLNLLGALLLGLVVGYERSYHGRAAGMRTLREAAIEKVFQGVTTVSEMVRVTGN